MCILKKSQHISHNLQIIMWNNVTMFLNISSFSVQNQFISFLLSFGVKVMFHMNWWSYKYNMCNSNKRVHSDILLYAFVEKVWSRARVSDFGSKGRLFESRLNEFMSFTKHNMGTSTGRFVYSGSSHREWLS